MLFIGKYAAQHLFVYLLPIRTVLYSNACCLNELWNDAHLNKMVSLLTGITKYNENEAKEVYVSAHLKHLLVFKKNQWD